MTMPLKSLVFSVFLVGCATEPLPSSDKNQPPIARAGEARSAAVADVLTFDGSASEDPDGDALTYRWSLVGPASSTTSLTSARYVAATLQPDVPGEYQVTLVVNDGLVDSEPATVLVTVAGPVVVPNAAPIAVPAGPATVVVGTVATLDGTASTDPDGDGIFFDWVLEASPEGSAARLDDPLSPLPTFTPDLPGEYALSLVVTDGSADSEPSPIVVTAVPVPNQPPTAAAGRNFNIATGNTARFDGTDSSDPEGSALSFRWSILNAPATSAAMLAGADTSTPSLQIDVDGTYEVELIVNDGAVDSAPDTVSVTAVTGNVPPNANAGPDQTVETGALVTLDGTGSSDVDGDPLTYRWSILSRPSNSSVQLANPLSANPRFTPSAVGRFEIQLIVSDGALDSAPDTVSVTTVSPNGVPIARAGPDTEARVFDSVALNGSASSDPDGDPLSYAWTFAFKPASSTAVVTNPTAAMASFEPDLAGTYTLMLTVDDGRAGHMDSVTVLVSEPWPRIEGDIIITEIMADPQTLDDSVGEWFEIFNPTNSRWDLRGCELSDLGNDSTLINRSLLVPPMSYVTLARSAMPGFGPDYVYSGFAIANGEDEIIITCGASEVAQVPMLPAFGFASSAPTGASIGLLRGRMSETDNDDGQFWCVSVADYNGDRGTPGGPNEFQTTCP